MTSSWCHCAVWPGVFRPRGTRSRPGPQGRSGAATSSPPGTGQALEGPGELSPGGQFRVQRRHHLLLHHGIDGRGEPPAHTAYRHPIARTFTPRSIEQLTDRARTVTSSLLDAMAENPAPDLVRDFAAKLPVTMIGRLLGHANPQSTARYAHLDDAHVLDAAEQIGAAIERMLS